MFAGFSSLLRGLFESPQRRSMADPVHKEHLDALTRVLDGEPVEEMQDAGADPTSLEGAVTLALIASAPLSYALLSLEVALQVPSGVGSRLPPKRASRRSLRAAPPPLSPLQVHAPADAPSARRPSHAAPRPPHALHAPTSALPARRRGAHAAHEGRGGRGRPRAAAARLLGAAGRVRRRKVKLGRRAAAPGCRARRVAAVTRAHVRRAVERERRERRGRCGRKRRSGGRGADAAAAAAARAGGARGAALCGPTKGGRGAHEAVVAAGAACACAPRGVRPSRIQSVAQRRRAAWQLALGHGSAMHGACVHTHVYTRVCMHCIGSC